MRSYLLLSTYRCLLFLCWVSTEDLVELLLRRSKMLDRYVYRVTVLFALLKKILPVKASLIIEIIAKWKSG